jgi:hypothetical protein
VHFFGDFLCASKESYSPVSIMFCAKSHRGDGRNNATGLERLVVFFARIDVATPLPVNVATGESLFLLLKASVPSALRVMLRIPAPLQAALVVQAK